MKLTQIVQLIVNAWPVLPAFVALAKAVHDSVDPKSAGGRWISHEERPDINKAFWDAYDKGTKR